MKLDSAIFSHLPVDTKAIDIVLEAEAELQDIFQSMEAIEAANQWKVLEAFQSENIAQRHFSPTTGYGYDDIGRDALDRVYAKAFHAEDAFVRPQITSGTQAIYLMLSGLLLPGDTILSVCGAPYDTLREAIGICGDAPGSLKQFGIHYKEIPLTLDGNIDIPEILEQIKLDPSIKMIYAQRSRGYSWRKAISTPELGKAIAAAKRQVPHILFAVDNCYGEFTETIEPTDLGADVMAGSLIKNPGGGIAPTGGYIVGKHDAIERIGHRFTVPGMGREVGSYAASYTPFFQGLFLAPHVTVQSLKSAALFARVFEKVGIKSLPGSEEARSDIIQSLQFKTKEALIAFCKNIQKAAPIDSFIDPEPWEMPGYQHQVIMAAGAFVQGSSIELSADAPIREPYIAYVQGSLTFSHGRIGAIMALDALIKSGEIA